MSPDVNEFLGRVRNAYGPDADAKARVRTALAATAVLSSAAAASHTVASHTAVAKVGLAAKLGGLRLVLGGLASTSVVVGLLVSSGWSTPWMDPLPPRVSVHLQGLASSGQGVHHALSGAARLSASVVTPVELVALAEPPLTAAPKQGHDAAPAQESPTGELLLELRLIRGATQSLRDGNVGVARQQLDEHRARFPSGKLALERRGLYVLVQCAGGKTEKAKEAARAYLESAPNSPLASHVRGDCLE